MTLSPTVTLVWRVDHWTWLLAGMLWRTKQYLANDWPFRNNKDNDSAEYETGSTTMPVVVQQYSTAQWARKWKRKMCENLCSSTKNVRKLVPLDAEIYYVYGLADFSCSRVSTATAGIG